MSTHSSASGHSSAQAAQSVNAWDPAFLEQQYASWKRDPQSVDASWRQFFLGFDLGLARPTPTKATATSSVAATTSATVPATSTGLSQAQRGVDAMIVRFREIGHQAAQLDPLGTTRAYPADLSLDAFGLDDSNLSQAFDPGTLPLPNPSPLSAILECLEETYCRSVGVEFMHIQDSAKRAWLTQRMESGRNRPVLSENGRRFLLEQLMKAESFENFLATRYIGKKRFGIEGGESAALIMETWIQLAPRLGPAELIIGMAHRGRLGMMVNQFGQKPEQMMSNFEESWQADFERGGGDVKYHQGYSSDRSTLDGGSVRVSLCSNPSHLEFVGSVALGRARARRDGDRDLDGLLHVPVVVHGNAAFAGQGTTAECFNMMGLAGYNVGGTLHLVINNQVGFTTDLEDGSTGEYVTGYAKSVEVPIFHVNGGDPEACAWVAQLAYEFRQEFRTDTVIDMWCWRKNGHNEADEPTYTQPVLYQRVKAAGSVVKRYADRLAGEGVLDAAAFEAQTKAYWDTLDRAQEQAKASIIDPIRPGFEGAWKGIAPRLSTDDVPTGVPEKALKAVAKALAAKPDGIAAHKTIEKIVGARGTFAKDERVDWAQAELLAYGSLLADGARIRLTGQDVERGTFSHRHAVVTCQKTGATWNALAEYAGSTGGMFHVFNSPLTESACLGFEYGYSLNDPNSLVIWEAQFGDFANGGQVFIDCYITTGQTKWRRASAMTLLLPHGNEGLGPEHSSARMERFLQLSDGDNICVCSPSTTAQIFHLLRRQLKATWRKPLVVMSPKSMLRLPAAQSLGAEFVEGSFRTVIDDDKADPKAVRNVWLCHGKFFHILDAKRQELGDTANAFVRLEQVSPFPEESLRAVLARYPGATVGVAQEEARNSGMYRFVQAQMMDRFGINPACRSRVECGSPSTGSEKMHKKEEAALIESVFAASDADGTLFESAPTATEAKAGAKTASTRS